MEKKGQGQLKILPFFYRLYYGKKVFTLRSSLRNYILQQ